MKVKDFRSAVNAAVEAWRAAHDTSTLPYGSLPVFYENGPQPDESKLAYWLDVELRFYSGHLTEIGEGAGGRSSGVIALSLYWKAGEGTGDLDELLDSLHTALRARRFGPAAFTLHGERMIPPPSFYGWYKTGYMIPFILDER